MADKEQVISALRATLLSVKGALTIKQCNRDYKELQGEWIPFRRLGYPSLDKLFIDVPGFKVTQIGSEWHVDAIASQETQHIAAMVAKQKSSKKSTVRYTSRFPKKQESWRKPSSTGNYYNNQYSSQYYRARGDSTPYNNNYKSVKYNYKTNETNNMKPFVKPNREQPKLNDYKNSKENEQMKSNDSIKINNSIPASVPQQDVIIQPAEGMSDDDATTDNEEATPSPAGHTGPSLLCSGSSGASAPPPSYCRRCRAKLHARRSAVPAESSQTQLRTHPEDEHRICSKPGSTYSIPTYKLGSRSVTESNGKPSGKVTASQRLSNLRDRLNTVDCIPLQLPAAKHDIKTCLEVSGLVTHVAPAHNLEPPPDSSSSVLMLEWTCRKLGLHQPVYKVHNMAHSKHGSYCSVKVGTTYSASSYPESAPTEELAKELAASKLLSEMESADAGGMPTSSSADAVALLADLVSEHEAGLWASTVPHLYREKYNENLPSNWQELVEKCPRIIKDRVVNGLLVLLPNREEAGVGALYEVPLAQDEMIDSELPMLQFPQDAFWNVYVTVASSPIEIWIRIIGQEYSEMFEALLVDMSEYYEHAGTALDKAMLIKNAWYAVKLDDGGWQRAKILDIEEDSATVFLGDHGDDDTVAISRIKILEQQFRKLPAQGVLCRLEGAEELAAHALGAELVRRRLSGEVLVAAPGPRADPLDPSVPLVLYDTSTQRDLNLNKEIVQDFCIAAAFNITHKLCEVEVGCVTDEGRVWVARAGGSAVVRAALDLLTAGAYRRQLPAAPHAPPAAARTLYIVRTLAGDWVRCAVISGVDGEGTVRTQLVDTGLVLRAPLSSLVPLAAFSPTLDAYPPQAVQVRLGEAERAAGGMVSRLRDLLLDARVLCRALPHAAGAAPASGSPPHVELFVRTGPQNILASVNNAILMEYDYLQLGKVKEQEKSVSEQVEALNKKKERIFRSLSSAGADTATAASGLALPPPALPDLGMCFDVHVAMAANPWNFVVQPNSTRNTLQTMMATLQVECPKMSESDAPKNPASGELYTVFYEKDSSWYRVTVAGSVSSEMVSVYFCDYGDLALFANRDLRPVPPAAALARSLPPQALKARLFDVWPLHQDWSVEDCVRFQELCVEQQFVAICKVIGKDPLNPSEPLITLDLIDTSTDDDVYLNQQLVSEGRARLSTA